MYANPGFEFRDAVRLTEAHLSGPARDVNGNVLAMRLPSGPCLLQALVGRYAGTGTCAWGRVFLFGKAQTTKCDDGTTRDFR